MEDVILKKGLYELWRRYIKKKEGCTNFGDVILEEKKGYRDSREERWLYELRTLETLYYRRKKAVGIQEKKEDYRDSREERWLYELWKRYIIGERRL